MCTIMCYCTPKADYSRFAGGLSRTHSRGPDDERILDTGNGLMGFQRLSIIRFLIDLNAVEGLVDQFHHGRLTDFQFHLLGGIVQDMPLHIDFLHQIPSRLYAGADGITVAPGFQLGHKAPVDGEHLDDAAFNRSALGVDLLDEDGVLRLILKVCLGYLAPLHQNLLLRVEGDVPLIGQFFDLDISGVNIFQIDLAVCVRHKFAQRGPILVSQSEVDAFHRLFGGRIGFDDPQGGLVPVLDDNFLVLASYQFYMAHLIIKDVGIRDGNLLIAPPARFQRLFDDAVRASGGIPMFTVLGKTEGDPFDPLEGLLVNLPQGQNWGRPVLDGKLMVFPRLQLNAVNGAIQHKTCRAFDLLAEDEARLHVGEADISAALGGVILVFVYTFPPDADHRAIQPAAGGLVNFLECEGWLAVIGIFQRGGGTGYQLHIPDGIVDDGAIRRFYLSNLVPVFFQSLHQHGSVRSGGDHLVFSGIPAGNLEHAVGDRNVMFINFLD